MSETKYFVENAKSGRSNCKKCKTPIGKGELRIRSEVPQDDDHRSFGSNWHVECFVIPKKLKKDTREFVEEVLQDDSGEILPEKADEIIAKLNSKGKTAAGAGAGDNDGNPLTIIKAEYEKRESEEEKPSKKAKSNMTAMVDAYASYCKMKNDELKDVLRWNRQVLAGKKDLLIMKCIDGEVFGRLAPCPVCSGKLKVSDDMTMIVCSGRFDEDAQAYIPCTNNCSQEDAPRLTPWYSSEPTEEEDAEMDRIVEEARGGKASSGSHDDDIESLKKKAAKLEWKLTGKAGIKKAVGDLLKVLKDHPNKLDLPDDEKDARAKLGPIIQMHRDKTSEEIIPFVVEEVGFLADKAAEEEKKEKSAETMCKNPKNAQIVAALKELSELYFKEGNRNAGGTYNKAVFSLKDLEFEITVENAKGLDKGKTKVPGIGKGTREKIEEFLKTGKIEKLEEKRAALG